VKRDVKLGCSRKLNNEEFQNWYSSPKNDQVKEDDVGKPCSTNEGGGGMVMNIGYWWAIISFYKPLHVSGLYGPSSREYTQSLMEAITPTTDPFLGYTL
jgi:hypothetical protein